jgi:hypothetical protein
MRSRPIGQVRRDLCTRRRTIDRLRPCAATYPAFAPALPSEYTIHGMDVILPTPLAQVGLEPSSFVICLRSPWDTQRTKLSLTRPLPASRPSLRPVLEGTWAFELVNGARCLFAGGATFVKGGLRLNYLCNGGVVYGDIDKTQQRWRAFFRLKGSQTMSRVEVATAWI